MTPLPISSRSILQSLLVATLWIAPLVNSQLANVSHINVTVDPSGDLAVNFEPIQQNGQKLEIHTSTDLDTWTLIATRPSGSNVWQSATATIEVDPDTGAVTATIPAQGLDQLFARVSVSSDPVPNDDSDGDGIDDWLENHVKNDIPEGRDSDGDGISDQIELLTGSDPGIDEFAEQQVLEASFPTGLKVFTPISAP